MSRTIAFFGWACLVGFVAVSCGRSNRSANEKGDDESGGGTGGDAGANHGGSSGNSAGRPNGGEAGNENGGSSTGGAGEAGNGTGGAGGDDTGGASGSGNAGSGGAAGDAGDGGSAGDGTTECDLECMAPQKCRLVNGFERCVCDPVCLGDGSSCDCWGFRDPTTGLTWENPVPQTTHNVYGGTNYCNGVVIGGYTDWRLPTIEDLRSLVRGCDATALGGACAVMNDSPTTDRTASCDGCGADGPGANGEYWDRTLVPYSVGYATFLSSSAPSNDDTLAWQIDFVNGGRITTVGKEYAGAVTCVRP